MTVRGDEPAGRGDETVRLRVPAAAEFVRLVRLAATALAARAGFDYDEVEDVRIVVGEACSTVLASHDDGDLLVCALSSGPGGLTIHTALEPGRPLGPVDHVAQAIFDSLGDRVDVAPTSITVTKRR